MAYKNIIWIKLEKRLLNDYRFYTLSEDSQLIYVKLLMLSAETFNKIPKNTEILKACFRSNLTPERIDECIKEIQKNFPKVKNRANYYYFQEWEYKHNRISGELPRNSQGTPQGALEEKRKEEKRKEDSVFSKSLNPEGLKKLRELKDKGLKGSPVYGEAKI